MDILSITGIVLALASLVGGSILLHGLPWLHHLVQDMLGSLGGALATIAGMLADAMVGIIAGALVLVVVTAAQRLRRPAAA